MLVYPFFFLLLLFLLLLLLLLLLPLPLPLPLKKSWLLFKGDLWSCDLLVKTHYMLYQLSYEALLKAGQVQVQFIPII